MKVLMLPKYGPLAASARLRFDAYVPHLLEAGVRCTSVPLLDDRYLSMRFSTGSRSIVRAMRAGARRVRAVLADARRFDLVLLQYEALPYLPGVLEAWLRRVRVPYVVDYDDAIFHYYDATPVRRAVLGEKIRRIMRGAAAVTAGSRYVLEYARAVNPRSHFLPTVVDLARYPPAPPARPPAVFTVGWIGSPSTAPYLQLVGEPLAHLARRVPLRLVAVGSGPVRLAGVDVEVRPWAEASEASEVAAFDVGIMPVPDTPWGRGKCGFKLIQYMACARPVIASPVGENVEIVGTDAGFLAGSADAWVAALERLARDPSLRDTMGRAGRARVERDYCLQVTAPRLLEILRTAARS